MRTAIVWALTEFDTVKDVSFLVGGQKRDTLTHGTNISGSYTRVGLNMAAIGEKPMAADAAGIHVERFQWIACAVNGLLGGAGGAYMIIAQLGAFSDNMTAGRGYIALAVVILGRYCPQGVFLAALLFGVANGAQIRLQALGVNVPMQLLAMLPYVITLIALLITSGRSREPESLAKPYIRGGR